MFVFSVLIGMVQPTPLGKKRARAAKASEEKDQKKGKTKGGKSQNKEKKGKTKRERK